MSLQDVISRAAPIINQAGSAYYFAPDTLARGTELGVDAMAWYIVGRGGAMGDTDPSAVAAAFGYFNPALVIASWTAAVEHISPRDAGREYLACGATFGRARFADIDGIERLAELLGAIDAAADPQGLGLYAALRAEPVVDDAPGRTAQLLTKLREFRGSAHLVAIRSLGIDPRTAHFAKRPEMFKMFGWDDAATPVVPQDFEARMAEAEAITDRIVTPAFAVLDAAAQADLLAGLTAVKAALG